jgi:hypothetical protein
MATSTQDKPKTEAKAASEDKAEEKLGAFIKFNAHNGVRVISKEDWEAIGVKDQDTATWDKTNAWRLPTEEFGARALNYLLKVDGEFIAED